MDEYDVLGGYLPSFVQHLKDTRARFGVGIGSQVSEDVGEAADAHASSVWTPAEFDAFFRAVAVHSRWRPDLIAACVPTKTEWEVWTYLEALEEGAAILAVRDADAEGGSEDEGIEAKMQVDGSSTDGDVDECEPALEVSQAWIDVEERMASWIVQEEHLASFEGGAADTEAVDDEPRKQKRPLGTGRGRAQSRARVQAGSQEGRPSPSCERSSTSARKRCREASISLAEKREALMGRLEVPHLLVLDSILREGEEEKSKSREGSFTTLTEQGDDQVRSVGPSPSDLQRTSLAFEMPSNMVIDPVLLAMSGGADPARAPSPGSTPTPGPSSPSLVQPGATTHTTEPDLSVFSPRSRRRIQKRLYMRRKRATLREGVLDTGIEKLRPGKKVKSEQSETRAGSTSVAPSEASSDAEREETENVRKKIKGGLTLPYKLKAQFAELGVDAAYLGREGMDMINLGALGKMTGLFEESGIVQSIDAQLIRHLQAAMVSFVTDIVHRAVVWREREIRLKQRSQVWRQGEHLTVAAVEHAVQAVGARYHSHKAYFESLTPATDTEADPDVEVADRTASPRLSPHRDVYTPLVRPPSGWRMGLSCLTRTYEREATRTRRGPSAELEGEEGEEETSDTTEEEADARDVALGRKEEARLWAKIKY